MADSIREKIVAAAAAAIDTACTAPVYRSRAEALSKRQAPSIVVEPGIDVLQGRVSNCKFDWELLLLVAVYVVGTIPDQVADPIVQQVHGALVGSPTFSILAFDCQPVSVEPQLEGGDVPASWTVMRFAVRYRTSIASIAS